MDKKYKDWIYFNSNEKIQFLVDYDKIEKFLKEYKIENYSIRPDGIVDVNGDVELSHYSFDYFPVKFGNVDGVFNCSYSEIKTLKGSPDKCITFNCYHCNNLKNLKEAPKECAYFNCSKCKNLKSLEGAPEKCNMFHCISCKKLESLKGAPEKCDYFWCNWCNNLKSLKGAPKECVQFRCSSCEELKTLEGAPRKM